MTRLIFKFRRIPVILVHLALIALANHLAFALRFDGNVPEWAVLAQWQMLPLLLAVRGLAFIPFRLYQGVWQYAGMYDLSNIIAAVVTSSGIFWLILQSSRGPAVYPLSVLVIDGVLLVFLLGGIRLTRRVHRQFTHGKRDKRVLIVGAGDAGEMIVRDMKNNSAYEHEPVGFIDDDPDKVGRHIHGVPVLGTRDELANVVKECRPHEILIAMPAAEPATVRALMRAMAAFRIPIKTLPNLRDLLDGKVAVGQIRNLAVEDLLSRAPVGLNQEPLKRLIRGRRVMITGAGGSIGSELARQVAALNPAFLVLYERYENSLYEIANELSDWKIPGLHAIIGDVTDANRLEAVMSAHRPDIVFHAAAHKHVPLMEANPCEAVKNNVRGTRVAAEIAERFGVDRFILISTDKAVNPSSVMGATKRVAELILQERAAGSCTSFMTVRFGNVLGSNGSVVPRFLDQIKTGGPVTITHPEIRRYFMLISEAVQLVLHAAALGRPGAVYVLDMGEQIRLSDLARDLIRLSGFVPDKEIPITYIGLRPGEKLSEELVGDGESVHASTVDKIMQVRSAHRIDSEALASNVDRLEKLAAEGRSTEVLTLIAEIVGGFKAGGLPRGVAAVPADVLPLQAEASARPAVAPAQGCPACGSSELYRSHARALHEKLKKAVTTQRLHRCRFCGWRGWRMILEHDHHGAAKEVPAPDLAAIDAAVGSLGPRSREGFSPRHHFH